MEDEVVIIEVEGKVVGFDTIGCEPGHFFITCNYEKEVYEVNQPITRRPEYVAIRDRYCGKYIKLIFKIDRAKSIFEKGQIVPQGKPVENMIAFELKSKSLKKNIVWYASFKTLLTHISTNEFIEEKSKPFTRVLTEDFRILCNGYSCYHISYCKFFNHSQTPIIKSKP